MRPHSGRRYHPAHRHSRWGPESECECDQQQEGRLRGRQKRAVAVDDLQEMHNHFQEQLDAGMKELAAKQGTGGLPKAPDTGTTASDVPPPPPDKTAGKTLEDQDKAADQTESDVKKETASSGGGSQ